MREGQQVERGDHHRSAVLPPEQIRRRSAQRHRLAPSAQASVCSGRRTNAKSHAASCFSDVLRITSHDRPFTSSVMG
jgi:hypothetical protein